MRTVIVCLTLMLASGGVAAEQAKSPKKITKTSVMKRAPQPVVAQRVPARKKVINSVASKPTVVASQKGAFPDGQPTSPMQYGTDRW